MKLKPGVPRNPRLTLAFWLDQASSAVLLAISTGVIPAVDLKWARFLLGLLAIASSAAGFKLTEPRRHWTNAERIARGLEPIYPMFPPPPAPNEDGK